MERTKQSARDLIILANDPSFTAWGWAVINSKNKVLACGCIKTTPESKARRIRKSDDRIRRISEINQQLLSIIDSYKVNYLLSELPHGSQNAAAAVMIGATAGICQTIADCLHLPIEWYGENDCKKALLNKISATKAETIGAIQLKYGVDWPGVKYKDEAIADALAVHYVASIQSPTLKFLS